MIAVMKAELVGNSVEVSLAPSEAMSIAVTVVITAALAALAGWQVAFIAFGSSLLCAVGLDLVQRLDE